MFSLLSYLLGQGRVLLKELDHAVCQLWVIQSQRLDLVQWQEDLGQESLVLLLQGQGESIDDTIIFFVRGE